MTPLAIDPPVATAEDAMAEDHEPALAGRVDQRPVVKSHCERA